MPSASLNDIICIWKLGMQEQRGDSTWLLCQKGLILLWELMGASCVSGLGYS